MNVSADEFAALSRLVNDTSGIVLDESKSYLIKDRLGPVAEEAGCATFCELYHRARFDDAALLQKVIDAITTNETLFFRDTTPFEALKYKAGPELIDAISKRPNPRRIRIWSAAASTGQEAYSIAMTFREMIPDVDDWDVQIIGTDISDTAIARASRGDYNRFEIDRGMNDALLSRYFEARGDTWRVKDELRSMVSFRRLNLLEPFEHLGMFDIVFCRNVAIYFEPEVQESLYNRVSDRLCPEGILFVGAAESLFRLGPRFVPEHHCRAVFYRPNLPHAAAA